jgi:hypothetical protein
MSVRLMLGEETRKNHASPPTKATIHQSGSGVLSQAGQSDSQRSKLDIDLRVQSNPYLLDNSRRPMSLERPGRDISKMTVYRLNKSVRINSLRHRGVEKLEFEKNMERKLEETVTILDNTIAFTLGDEGKDYSYLKPKPIRKMDTHGSLDEPKDASGRALGKKKTSPLFQEFYGSLMHKLVLNDTYPKIVEFSKSNCSCEVRIPYDPTRHFFPLTLISDSQSGKVNWHISVTNKIASQTQYDYLGQGGVMQIAQPAVGMKLFHTFTGWVQSNKPGRMALSYGFSKGEYSVTAKLVKKDELFSKENADRLKTVYRLFAKDLLNSKRERLSKVNHILLNVASQSQRVPTPEKMRQLTTRAMLREQKTVNAKIKAEEYVFEKAKSALIQTYSHDFRIYLDDEEFKKNYRSHLKIAVQAIWIHAITLVSKANELKEIIFRKRYKLLKQQVKRAKQTYAVRMLKDTLNRLKLQKGQKTIQLTCQGIQLAAQMLDPVTINEKCSQLISAEIFSQRLIDNLRRVALLEDYIFRSIL